MFGFFKKTRKKKQSSVQFADLKGNILKEGDVVLSHRYELGKCIIKKAENGFEYESLATHKKVNWVLMIDAATDRQKVEKVD